MGCCCAQRGSYIDEIDDNLVQSKVFIESEAEANAIKQEGNKHYKQKAYDLAIKCYLRAIARNPNQMTYYTNLALAHKSQREYEKAIQVINTFLKHPFSHRPDRLILLSKGKIIKARCLCCISQSYILQENYTENKNKDLLKRIDQAINLLKQASSNSQLQVKQFQQNCSKIKTYLQTIDQKGMDNQLLQFLSKKIATTKHGLSSQSRWNKISQFIANEDQLYNYTRMCVQENKHNTEDKQFFLDSILYEKFKKPVIAPSGITYEQNVLLQYFKKGQYNDPITKENFPVGQQVLIPNNNLKSYMFEQGKHYQVSKQQIQLLQC